jgi:hypothetical protein
VADERTRARVLSIVVKSLASLGEAERALAVARGIKVPDWQATALAYTTLGFAEMGENERARALLKEVDRLLPTVVDIDQKSRVGTSAAKARVRLGDYHAAMNTEVPDPDPDDRIAVYIALTRDDATRRNPLLDKSFVTGPFSGLGRYGFDWP